MLKKKNTNTERKDGGVVKGMCKNSATPSNGQTYEPWASNKKYKLKV
jgi:hypothetical protein